MSATRGLLTIVAFACGVGVLAAINATVVGSFFNMDIGGTTILFCLIPACLEAFVIIKCFEFFTTKNSMSSIHTSFRRYAAALALASRSWPREIPQERLPERFQELYSVLDPDSKRRLVRELQKGFDAVYEESYVQILQVLAPNRAITRSAEERLEPRGNSDAI